MFLFVIRELGRLSGGGGGGGGGGDVGVGTWPRSRPQPASYALKKTFFHVDRHAGHIGRRNLHSLVTLAVVQKVTQSLAASSFFFFSLFFWQERGSAAKKAGYLFCLLGYLQRAVYLSYLPFHQSPFDSTVGEQ